MQRLICRATPAAAFPCPDTMSVPLHALLCARGLGSLEEAEQFLNPSLTQLHDPMLLPSMAEAVARVKQAQAAKETICVYGDYDVDGVSATAILLLGFRLLGIDAHPYIPSRHDDGYGLNEAAIREISSWAQLLISVDCGITAFQEVGLAKQLQMDVIVTDHHKQGETLPDCPVINPLLGDYPYRSLCGAGVAFKLLCAIDKDTALRFLDLAALATVADVVPLTGENRTIVALGLVQMRKSPRPGLLSLLRQAGIPASELRAGNIAFQIGPRLNAGGRLGDAKRALSLLIAETQEEAQPFAEELEQENTHRREVEQSILQEAAEAMQGFDFLNRRAIVLAGHGWNVGVIGLAASRLVEQHNLPVVLLGGSDKDQWMGSCRSIPGVDIHKALSAVSDLLVRFGGHKQAAGLTIEKTNLPAFIERLNAYIQETTDPICFIPTSSYDAEARLSEIDLELASLIERLEPFGMGNPAPVFLSAARVERARGVGANGIHLSMNVSGDGAQRQAIGWRMAGDGTELPRNGAELRLLYALKRNQYRGDVSVQLEIKTLLPPSHRQRFQEAKQNEAVLLQAFLTDTLYNRAYPAKKSMTPMEQPADIEMVIHHLLRSPYGTLVVLTGLSSLQSLLNASELRAADACFDLLLGRWPDSTLPTNAVCLLPAGALPIGYARLFALDAPLCLFEQVPVQQYFPSTVRADWLGELPDIVSLRALYKAAREHSQRPYYPGVPLPITLATDSGQSVVKTTCGLIVLRDMGLIEYQPNPPKLHVLPMFKVGPTDSKAYQFLMALGSE